MTSERQPQSLPPPPRNRILCGDALTLMRQMPSASVDAIITDPPYFRVKSEAWDRQWDSAASFLAWIDELAKEWQRLLKPNGSLYVFASPQMAARVEMTLQSRFHVLNQIVWRKDAGRHRQASKELLRGFFPMTERIIFAEHYGADSMALGESGYAAQCEKVHGHVFEPLRAYLAGELKRAGIKPEWCNEACGTRSMAARHYFSRSQWCLPTEPHYRALQRMFNERGRRPAPAFDAYHTDQRAWRYHSSGAHAGEYLRADYEELRADYEELRADYEELRRPFSVTADVPYTDVWDFATVAYRPGKHPCEKPLDLMRHILRCSTRPGTLTLDCFAGSGSTLVAAALEGRAYIGIERESRYVEMAEARIRQALAKQPQPVRTTKPSQQPQRPRIPAAPTRPRAPVIAAAQITQRGLWA